VSVGSGLAGSLGIAAEASYGTYQAPTRFIEINSASLKKNKNVVQGGGLAAGRLVQPVSRRVVTQQDASGDVELEVTQKNMGLLLAQIFGGAVTPLVQGATAAYLQTHTLVDNVGRYLTAQVGVPDTTGTVRPYTYLGCKVVDTTLACGVGELLTAQLSLDARQVSEVQTLAAPSYTTGLKPFHFAQMNVKIGAFGAEAAVSGVRKVTTKITRAQKTDRFYANSGGLKAEPLVNDRVSITGTIETDFVDKTVFADVFAADGNFSLIWEFVGANIASTYYETFRIKIPAVALDGDTPQLGGPDVVSPSFNFTGLNDLTNNPITCEYISTDTAL